MTLVDHTYRFEDRFERHSGRVYLTGAEALVRLPLMQRRRDAAAGLNTAGFVSGYPGSPLGNVDTLFRNQRAMLADHDIHFSPGLNEDLAATAVWGSQHVGGIGVTSRYDGVFGLWYGKGPGLERSTDAMRTANVNGVHHRGGVLALAGDDHHGRSTVTAQQSETLFIHMHMPVLNPAGIQDYLDFGLAGWELSRFAGSWVGMICLNDTADSSESVEVDPERPHLQIPDDPPALPPFGTIRSGGVLGALGMEREIRELRLPAAQRFIRATRLDRIAIDGRWRGHGRRGLGIVAAGRAYLDVVEGLSRLGLTPDHAAQLGISVYKVAMPWPLDPDGLVEFADGLEELLVIEPKHPVMEDQIGRYLRRLPADRRPALTGKVDDTGTPLVPETGGIDAVIAAKVVLRRLRAVLDDAATIDSLRPKESLSLTVSPVPARGSKLVRAAGFCSGCPHNVSTQVPDGSFGIGGTGCHGMAEGMAEPRRTRFHAQMGGEGGLWLGMAPFADDTHVFQNMGDGTYSHSGALAIRAAVAADVTMTFKLLLNGYISMTGGQSIPGGLSVQQVAAQVLAEEAREVVVITDDVAKYRSMPALPDGVGVHDRRHLLAAEEHLRSVPGVTVLIYDQACAAELRRERRKGRAADPDKRVFINEAVCEGCGDCNAASNCISVEPLETDFGRKRTINQSTCNKDFSCLNGYCPSFVTLRGATPRRRAAAVGNRATSDLPTAAVAEARRPYNIVVGGIGGGGVLTIGALIGMAAHLEGLAVTVLNETGLAQKNGAVQSHVRVCSDRSAQLGARIGQGSTDLVLGADLVVVAAEGVMSTLARDRTTAVLNERVQPTVAFAQDDSLDFSGDSLVRTIRDAIAQTHSVDAISHATALMGDAIYANLFLLGYAAQLGLLPVSLTSLERAIELNGLAVQHNQQALRWGRLAAHDPGALPAGPGTISSAPPVAEEDLEPIEALAARRQAFLTRYQNAAYAQRFARAVNPVIDAERHRVAHHDEVSRAAIEGLFKLMAYKDEYEVARLYTDAGFRERLAEEFEGDFRWSVNLAPQVFNRRDPRTGRARKWEIPSGVVVPAFRVLSAARPLRGTKLDIFGQTAHRRAERARITWYEGILGEITARLSPDNHSVAVQLAQLPLVIKGYDTIKDESAASAERKAAALLEELRSSGDACPR
jgi:indolepyruvate ferredoxin oxidoreductase